MNLKSLKINIIYGEVKLFVLLMFIFALRNGLNGFGWLFDVDAAVICRIISRNGLAGVWPLFGIPSPEEVFDNKGLESGEVGFGLAERILPRKFCQVIKEWGG